MPIRDEKVGAGSIGPWDHDRQGLDERNKGWVGALKLVGSFEDGMIMLGRVHVFFNVGFSKDSKEFSDELEALKGQKVVVSIMPEGEVGA